MKKNNLLLTSFIAFSFLTPSCFNKEVVVDAGLNPGDKVFLSGTGSHYISVKESHKIIETDSLITELDYSLSTSGSKSYSYFDVSLKFSYSFMYLNETGVYVASALDGIVNVDKVGTSSSKKNQKLNYRSIRDFSFAFDLTGYIVRK
jgi:hypothetical protein